MIKCPVCSRVYSYGRKITHLCEGNTYFFGSIFNEGTPEYQWNCSPHPRNISRSISKHSNVQSSSDNDMKNRIELNSENESSKILYPWNCQLNQNIASISIILSIADKQLIYE